MALIPIPDDWSGMEWDCYVIEWPSSISWKAILLGQLTAPSKGRFWDERTGTITDAQAIGLEIFRRNILGGGMTCFDDLALAVRYLADQLYSKPCCPDAVNLNVIQSITTGGNQVYGTEAPTGLEGEAGVGDPPAGYASWGEYETKKCQSANLVADGLIAFYGNLGAISIGSATAIAAAIGLAVPGIIAVPPAIIPLLVASLLGLGVSITVLTAVGGWLEDNRADLVCLLYESDTVSLAIDAFAALIDEALIALAISSTLHPYVKAVALAMASTDTLNQLFDANLGISYSGADCSGCAPQECEPFEVDFRTTPTHTFVGGTSCSGIAPLGTVTISNEPGEGERVTVTAGSGDRRAILKGDGFNNYVEDGANLQTIVNNYGGSNIFVYYMVETDQGCVTLGGISILAGSTITYSPSIANLVGKRIQEISINISASANLSVDVERIRLICPA